MIFLNVLQFCLNFFDLSQIFLTILNSSKNSTTFLNFFLPSKFLNFSELFSTFLVVFQCFMTFLYLSTLCLLLIKISFPEITSFFFICTVYYVLFQLRISPNLPLKAIAGRSLKATKIFPCSPKVLPSAQWEEKGERERKSSQSTNNMDFPNAASSFRCDILTWQLEKQRKMRQPISFAKAFGIFVVCYLHQKYGPEIIDVWLKISEKTSWVIGGRHFKNMRKKKNFKTPQKLRMLSLSLYIQGPLWMLRLLFLIVRNVIQDCFFGGLLQLSLSLSFSLYLSLSLSFC